MENGTRLTAATIVIARHGGMDDFPRWRGLGGGLMENGERRMENGEWRKENGERRMENGEWRKEKGCSVLQQETTLAHFNYTMS